MKKRIIEVGYWILVFLWVGTAMTFTVDVVYYVITGKSITKMLISKVID